MGGDNSHQHCKNFDLHKEVLEEGKVVQLLASEYEHEFEKDLYYAFNFFRLHPQSLVPFIKDVTKSTHKSEFKNDGKVVDLLIKYVENHMKEGDLM